MWLTRLALRNPIFILMMSLMTVALGWVSLTHLSVDMFPNIDIPLVQVVTIYTGAGPQGPPVGKLARVRRVELQIGVDGGDWLEVTSGLKPGDEIVTAGIDVIGDGALGRALEGVDPSTGRPVETASKE